MDTDLIVPVIFRWLHIGPVIVAIGGAFFARLVVLPSMMESLSEEQRAQIQPAMASRWRKTLPDSRRHESIQVLHHSTYTSPSSSS